MTSTCNFVLTGWDMRSNDLFFSVGNRRTGYYINNTLIEQNCQEYCYTLCNFCYFILLTKSDLYVIQVHEMNVRQMISDDVLT